MEESVYPWFCLTPKMMEVIASYSGVVYFIDANRCSVKANGIMITIGRKYDSWLATSSSQRFYDWAGKFGKPIKRGEVVRLSELQMYSALCYIGSTKISEEEK